MLAIVVADVRNRPTIGRHDWIIVGPVAVGELPDLTIGDADRKWIVRAVEEVVADTENIGGAIWELGRSLASAAIRTKVGR